MTATLIDGNGGPPIPDAVVLVSGARACPEARQRARLLAKACPEL